MLGRRFENRVIFCGGRKKGAVWEKDISLYDLTIECKTKMLLTDSEIKHISKKGVLPF